MQQILELLASMGIGGENLGWEDVSNISGTDIATSLADLYGFEGEFGQGLFQPISTQQMQNLLPKTYTPFMTASQQPLISSLISQTQGKKGRAAAGGFAGSGAHQMFQGQAKDVYGKGMADTLGSISQSRSQQQTAVMDLIDQWRQTAAGLTSPGGGE